MAEPKPTTLNPSTNEATNQNNSPFITKVKSPRVSMFIGKVNITNMGFKNIFTKPKRTATIRAMYMLETETPGNKYAVIIKAKAATNHLINKFILFFFR